MAGYCACLCPHRAWNNVLPDIAYGTQLSDSSSVDPNAQWNLERAPGRDYYSSGSTKSLRASICLKLTIFVGLLVIVASGVPALVLWLKAHEQLVDELNRRLITVSTLRQEQLRSYLYSETDKMDLISNRIIIDNYLSGISNDNRSSAKFDLNSAIEVISDFAHAAIYDWQGQLAFSTNDSMFEGTINSGDLNTIAADGIKIAFPILTPMGWMYNVSQAIYKKQTLIGVLMTWVNGSELAELVYDRTGLQSTGELLVGVVESVDSVHLLFPPLENPSLTTIPKSPAMASAMKGEIGIMNYHDYDGVKVIAAYRPVGFLHWGLLAKLDIHEAYAPVQNVRTVIIITIVVLLFAGILASLGLAKIFSSPIVELGRAAVALGHGDMTTRVKKGTVLLRDELADLKDIFNSMAHQIADHHQTLEHKVRERTADLALANQGLAKEVQERKKVEIELEKAKDSAMAANRSKSEFLANMSHEIRTPLNAVINFTEFCLDTNVTSEQREHLDHVRFAAQHLLRLITDILDFSKIEAGKLEMEEIPFSLCDQLEHAVSVLAARALENKVELCCSVDRDVPDQIMGDPGRLLQIFVNLIGNGIKFTKEGEVIVSVSVENKSEDSVELLFSVRDTGLGIPEDKQLLLFQAFSQVDSSTQRVYGGTGLGLLISSKLAVAMCGRMWVKSDGKENKGSTFYFTAKFKLPPSSGARSFCTVHFKDVRGLVVDDNETNRKILVDLLEEWGIVAHAVDSVEAALSMLQKAADGGHKYHLVLLDMWLSGTSSSELVSALRERPAWLAKPVLAPDLPTSSDGASAAKRCGETASEGQDEGSRGMEESLQGERGQGASPMVNSGSQDAITNESQQDLTSVANSRDEPGFFQKEDAGPSITYNVEQTRSENLLSASREAGSAKTTHDCGSIIMLTSVDHTDAARCKELGVINHVSKPIKHSLLLRVLQSALGSPQKGHVEEEKLSTESESPSRSLHILVAEDNLVNQQVAVKFLQKWGHTAVVAGNGADAVDKAMREEFDLILMDVQMPICDGFEATARIREAERSQKRRNHIPIIAMTAHAMSGDGDRCIAAGMDYYISKPLNSKKLQELLQTVAKDCVNGQYSRAASR